MTDQRDKPGVEPDGRIGETRAAGAPAPISRRALMTGASVALPTILTLNSSAAFGLAVTSAVVRTRLADAAATGDAICVIGTETPGGATGVYEVSQSDFYRVRGDLYYRTGPDDLNPGVTYNAEQACESSLQQVYYSSDGTSWTARQPLGGAVASLTDPAITSVSVSTLPIDWPTL